MLSIVKYYRADGYAHHLKMIEWAIFAVLTWSNDSRGRDNDYSEALRRVDFHKMMGCVCRLLRLRQKNLLIYLKTEWGEDGRGHYHVLIGSKNTERTSPELLATTMKQFWPDRERSKIQPFDASRQSEGVAYQTKKEFNYNGHPRINYEWLSPALLAMVRTNTAIGSHILAA